MNPDLIRLTAAWSEAIGGYRSAEAREVARELVPRLRDAGAIDLRTAVTAGGFAYWVRPAGAGFEVARSPLVTRRRAVGHGAD